MSNRRGPTGREDWDLTMAQSGDAGAQVKKTKRFSGRIRSLTKTVRVIDEESRRELRDSRLEALEADNHGDAGHDEGDDDAYNIESDAEFGVAPAKTRKTESRKHSSSATGSSSGPNWNALMSHMRPLSYYTTDLPTASTKPTPTSSTSTTAVPRTSSDEQSSNTTPDMIVNYKTVCTGPATAPARKTCSVCGFLASYTCTRCGSRYCCLRCQDTHKETKCAKFG